MVNFRSNFEKELWKMRKRKLGMALPNLREYRKLDRSEKARIQRAVRKMKSKTPRQQAEGLEKSFNVMRQAGNKYEIRNRLKLDNIYTNLTKTASSIGSEIGGRDVLHDKKGNPRDPKGVYWRRRLKALNKLGRKHLNVAATLFAEAIDTFNIYVKGDWTIVASPNIPAKMGSRNGGLVMVTKDPYERIKRTLEAKGYAVNEASPYNFNKIHTGRGTIDF